MSYVIYSLVLAALVAVGNASIANPVTFFDWFIFIVASIFIGAGSSTIVNLIKEGF